MFNDILNDIWNNYRGRLLLLGVWPVYRCGCAVAGIFSGTVSDDLHRFWAFLSAISWIKKEDLLEWLDRLLPPGYHR